MRFEEQLRINASHQKVWEFFKDPLKLAACIPGCQSVEAVDETRYRAVMADKVGPFRVSFNVEVKIEEMDEASFIKARVTGKDKKLDSSFQQILEANIKEVSSTQTQVNLATEVNFLGKIASLGYTIIKRKAAQAMKQFGETVRAQLEGG
ncbi:hypothetical protein MYX82_09775 [Acidobacteria bacterium AH-259-D05]|nr:hypothetical protein [Acidobacteria bacterium AH-259-D05]